MTDESPAIVQAMVNGHRRFLTFLESRVPREEAEDILQAAFVKGLQHADSIRDEETAVAWFYRVLRNAVTDRHRRRAAESRALTRKAGEAAAQTAEDADLHQAVCTCVMDLLPTLRPDQAELLHEVDLGGTAVSDVAERLGITAGSARVRLHRARRALADRLRRACGTCAEHGCLDCSCSPRSSV